MFKKIEDTNWRDFAQVKRYAERLHTSYGLIIIWNGLRYQVKHEATEAALLKMGYPVSARIPAQRD